MRGAAAGSLRSGLRSGALESPLRAVDLCVRDGVRLPEHPCETVEHVSAVEFAGRQPGPTHRAISPRSPDPGPGQSRRTVAPLRSRRPIAHADPSRWPELSGEGAFARATTVPSGSPCRRQWPTAKQPRKVQSVSSNSTHTRKLGTPDGWSSTSESSNLAINSRSRLIVALSQHAQPLRWIIHGNRAVP